MTSMARFSTPPCLSRDVRDARAGSLRLMRSPRPASHELCEVITDAIPGQGWYDDANGEIGDICAWKTKKVGNYTVQLEWSNKANNFICLRIRD